MSKRETAERAAPQKRRARALIVWEDTERDGPRTWSIAMGDVALEDVLLLDHEPQNNSGMAKAKLTRFVDELELV
jgi:hypothetical protein